LLSQPGFPLLRGPFKHLVDGIQVHKVGAVSRSKSGNV
jgi:hypothetical protein